MEMSNERRIICGWKSVAKRRYTKIVWFSFRFRWTDFPIDNDQIRVWLRGKEPKINILKTFFARAIPQRLVDSLYVSVRSVFCVCVYKRSVIRTLHANYSRIFFFFVQIRKQSFTFSKHSRIMKPACGKIA